MTMINNHNCSCIRLKYVLLFLSALLLVVPTTTTTKEGEGSTTLTTAIVTTAITTTNTSSSTNNIIEQSQRRRRLVVLELCSGICEVGYNIEFPTKVIRGGKTCQELNDSKHNVVEDGSEGCNLAKKLIDRCGCILTSSSKKSESKQEEGRKREEKQQNNNNIGYLNIFKEKQQKALKITPHITGMLSLLGSLFVIQDIMKDRKGKLSRTYPRLVLGMSILDSLASLGYFIGTWGLPLSTRNTYVCTFQGFLIQLGVAVPIYNACLSMYYLLVLKYKWSERRIQKASIENFLHIISTGFGIGTAIIGLALTLYNSTGLLCHISSYPFYCWKSEMEDQVCARGQYSNILIWIFYYGPIWTCIIVTTIVMTMVTIHVMKEERASRKWRRQSNIIVTTAANAANNNKKKKKDKMRQLSSQVFWQSVLYVSVFYLTWLFPTTLRILQTKQILQKNSNRHFYILLFTLIFVPLQGFFNAFIYIYPRWWRSRSRSKRRQSQSPKIDNNDDEWWLWQSVRRRSSTVLNRLLLSNGISRRISRISMRNLTNNSNRRSNNKNNNNNNDHSSSSSGLKLVVAANAAAKAEAATTATTANVDNDTTAAKTENLELTEHNPDESNNNTVENPLFFSETENPLSESEEEGEQEVIEELELVTDADVINPAYVLSSYFITVAQKEEEEEKEVEGPQEEDEEAT